MRAGISFPALFVAMIWEKNMKTIEIRNFGICGATAGRILAEEVPEALAFRPDLSILLAGTNNTCNSHALTDMEVFRTDLLAILNSLKNAGSCLILMTIPPFCPELLLERHDRAAYGNVPPEERVAAANRVIVSVAEETGALAKELSAADSYLTNPNNSDYRDGVHPNRRGYALTATLILDAIRRNGLPCSRIACLGDSITYGQYMSGAGTAEGDTYPGQLHTLLNNE